MNASHTYSFLKLKAAKKLREFAQDPIDFHQAEVLTPERIADCRVDACGLRLLYSGERVDDAVMRALFELAKESRAKESFSAMIDGHIINKIEGYDCENRAVLHTALRDVFAVSKRATPAAVAAAKARKELDKLESFCAELLKGAFTDMILVGIGGSDLGPRAIYHALAAYSIPQRHLHFISNVDPDDAAAVLRKVKLEKTLVTVVSKSGTTLETLTNEEFLRAAFREKKLDPNKHFIAVTGEKSPMDNPKRYLRSFYIWDYIGGRYSVTSCVGGVVLAFALGYEHFVEFLRGAHDIDNHARTAPEEENLPLISALLGIWNRNFLHASTVAVIPYSQALIRFAAHLQQCDMESNGKHIDRHGRPIDYHTGPVIWGEPGTNAQHSFFQLIHQGTDVIPVEFMAFSHSQYGEDVEIEGTLSQDKLLANVLAQSLALSLGQSSDNPNAHFAGNRPNRILMAKKLDPYAMGAILSYYEHKIAFQGFIWGINSFDQEGVQLGKKLATRVLNAKTKKERFLLGEAMFNALL